MDLQAFMKSIDQKKASGDSSVGQVTKSFDFFMDKAKALPIDLDAMPTVLRNSVDDLATCILDSESNKTIIVGEPFSGKTFLLEQLLFNIDYYLNKTAYGPLHVVSLTDVDMMNFNSADDLRKTAKALTNELNVMPRNICFYTESPEIALYLATVIPEWRIILEINSETFEAIVEQTMRTTSKAWYPWSRFDVNDVLYTQKDLVKTLMLSAMPRIEETYPKGLTEAQLNSLFTSAIKTVEGLEETVKGEKLIKVPAGVWAVMLRTLAATMAFASDPKLLTPTGAPSFAKISNKTLEEFTGLMEPFLEEEKRVSPSQMINLITGEIDNLFQANSSSKEIVPKEAGELIFNDVSNLGERLKKNIFGEDEALDKVAKGFIVPAAGLNDPTKPVRSLFLLGPTGVGKTQLALNLAKELTAEPLNVVRIDMSEYQQEHEVAKLFGAPPGYVGFDNGGVLTSAVLENPHSLILLDEVEKADPKVWDAFLQILDSGTMTDSQGRVVDFTKTVIVMTSNVGAAEASRKKLGFMTGGAEAQHTARVKESEHIVKKELEKSFRPEFLNRIDEIVIFKEISQDVARAIVKREISIVQERMKTKGFSLLAPSDEVVNLLVEQADIMRYGAREIQRIVFKQVASPSALFIVNGGKKNKTLVLTAESGNVFVIEAERKTTK